MYRHASLEFLRINFFENLFDDSRVVTCGLIDGEAWSVFCQLLVAKAPRKERERKKINQIATGRGKGVVCVENEKSFFVVYVYYRYISLEMGSRSRSSTRFSVSQFLAVFSVCRRCHLLRFEIFVLIT